MSTIRILGIIFSFLIFIYSLSRYKIKKFNKTDLLICLAISGSIILISLNPNIVNFVSDIIAGRYVNISRLLSIVIISIFFLFVLILRAISKINATEINLGKLVEVLAIAEFNKKYKEKRFDKKIIVVIPAYNEDENIGNLLRKIPPKVFDYEVETLVIVDGSTDNTEEVVRALGFPVAKNNINRGGGSALKVGYQISFSINAEIIVTLDADGQHQPEEIERLVKPIIEGKADFVSGSRILGSYEKLGYIRRAGIFFFNKAISILLRRRITDCSNAFRALKTSELRKLDLKEDQFHTSELIINAVRKGIRFKEVPVTILKRQGGETKKPGVVKYGWGFARAIFKTWWRE